MMKKIKAYLSYAVITLVFGILGFWISFAAQHGGISQKNGFLAPLMGPWSRILPPNARRFKYWEADEYTFPVIVTVITVVLLLISSLPKHKALRVITKILAHAAVIFWCLCGLGKVLMELT